MKLCITNKQLNELSEKGKKRLGKWWEENGYMRYGYMRYRGYEYDMKGNKVKINPIDPILSIGQMVEFLDDHETIWDLQKKDVLVKPFWRIGVGEKLIEKDELVDALWELVREVLEKND